MTPRHRGMRSADSDDDWGPWTASRSAPSPPSPVPSEVLESWWREAQMPSAAGSSRTDIPLLEGAVLEGTRHPALAPRGAHYWIPATFAWARCAHACCGTRRRPGAAPSTTCSTRPGRRGPPGARRRTRIALTTLALVVLAPMMLAPTTLMLVTILALTMLALLRLEIPRARPRALALSRGITLEQLDVQTGG